MRVRILATLLLVTGLGMAVAGTTAYLVQRERVLSTVDERLRSLATDAADVASGPADDLDAVMTTIIQRLRPGSNESSLGVIDGVAALSPGGTVDFRLDGDRELVRRAVEETAGGDVVLGTIAEPGRPSLRYLATPVSVQGDPRGGVFVVAVDLPAELRPLSEAFGSYALIAAGAFAVVAVVGWFVAGRLLRPIRALTEATNRITATDLSERIPVAGNDDISQLTVTVNGMLDRLEGAIDAQRRLLDDVGHELKTPITIVRGHLELVDPDDPADVSATRALAIDELDRMSGLVGDIALLAGAGRAGGLVRAPVDLAELGERIRSKAAVIADRDWVLTASAEGRAALDVDRITQALLQLAANAVVHGSADGDRIELSSAWRPGGALVFSVRDFGPGIPAEAQERVFERFQRGPDAAVRGRGRGGRGAAGSGLGLAIVTGIAAAHGGHVELVSAPGEGAGFSIVVPAERLPAAGASSSVTLNSRGDRV